MTYFKNVNTLEELRKQYKELLKKYHPDNPQGSTEATQDINAEYDKLFRLLKDKHESNTEQTNNKTSFPISNVHEHQIKHIRNIYKHGGIVFLIISMNNKYFMLMGKDFIDYIDNNERKSIPYEYIKNNAIEVNMTLRGLDYLSKLGDKIWKN